MQARHHRLIIGVCLVLFLASASWFAGARRIDGDEGYYAAAAELAAGGQAVYTDFFYPQMPYLPSLLAAAGRLTGYGIGDLRPVSVALAGLGLLFWALLASRRPGLGPWLLAAGILMIACEPHLLSWNVTVKTFAATGLAVCLAWWALIAGATGGRAWWWLLAGAACGLAVGVRGMFAPWAVVTVIAAGWAQGRRSGPRAGALAAGLMAAGAAVVLLPALLKLVQDPDRFLFNNLRYHQLRYNPFAETGGASRWLAAVGMLARSVVLQPSQLLLAGLAAWGGWSLRGRPDDPWRAPASVMAAATAAFVVTGLLPNPVYEQYFTATLPLLLAPLALLGLEDLARRTRPSLAAAAVIVVMAALGAVGAFVTGVGQHREEVWTFDHLDRVARRIEARTRPGDRVLAFWSGYPPAAGRAFEPGMENHFALGVSEKLSFEEQIRYHVAGKELLLIMFTRRDPALVVLGAWNHEIDTAIPQDDLVVLLTEMDRQYEVVEVLGDVKLMARRATPLPEAPPAP